MKFDAFICFVKEDKETVAIALADGLRHHRYDILFEEFSIEDRGLIQEKIENGLEDSRYAIIILSEDFLKMITVDSKLDKFVIQENVSGKKRMLPVWHDVIPKTVEKYSPSLVDRLSATTEKGIGHVIPMLVRVLGDPINDAMQSTGARERQEIGKIMTRQKYTMNIYAEWHSDLVRESRIAVSAWVRQFENSTIKMPALSNLKKERSEIAMHITRLLLYYEQWAILAEKEKIDKVLILKLLSSYLAWYHRIFIVPLKQANQKDDQLMNRLSLMEREVFTDEMFNYNSLRYE